ncbi:MAG: zf-HC2 domain-containing protein [Vicinamibacterales bacterium]
MLNCKEITQRASDFLDGTLPWRDRLEVRLHLMMCRFCREYLRQMNLVVRTLRRLPARKAAGVKGDSPVEVDEKLLELFRAGRS